MIAVDIAIAFAIGAMAARVGDWLAARIAKRHRWACGCFSQKRTRIVDAGGPGNCNCFMICGHEPQSTPRCFHYGANYKMTPDGKIAK